METDTQGSSQAHIFAFSTWPKCKKKTLTARLISLIRACLVAAGEGQVFIFIDDFLTIFFQVGVVAEREHRGRTDASSPLISLAADNQAAR